MDRPHTQYARIGELAIAYQVHGSGDHDMLLSGGTVEVLGLSVSPQFGQAGAVQGRGPTLVHLMPGRSGAVDVHGRSSRRTFGNVP